MVGDINVCSDDSRKVVNPFSIENILSEDRGSARGRPLPPHFVTQPAGFLVRSPAGSYQSSDVSPSDYSAPSSPERHDSDSEDEERADGEMELRLRLQEGEDRNLMVVPVQSPFQEQNSNDNSAIKNLQKQNVSAGSLMQQNVSTGSLMHRS